jgi:hypothetical protein
MFEVLYLLEYWELDCACHPNCSARFVDTLEHSLSRFESRRIYGNTLNFSSCSVFSHFQTFASQIACLEIQYLRRFWVVGHECHLVDSTNHVNHHGGLLVQIGALVKLQCELQ